MTAGTFAKYKTPTVTDRRYKRLKFVLMAHSVYPHDESIKFTPGRLRGRTTYRCL
jgi:hypothetical protein